MQIALSLDVMWGSASVVHLNATSKAEPAPELFALRMDKIAQWVS